MKFIKTLAAVALLLATGAVSFIAGREYEAYYYNYEDLYDRYQEARQAKLDNKDYQAACMLSDICHFALDNDESGEFEELYWDYVDNIDCDSAATITKEEIVNYHWCY